jgi:hypothetical protein
MRLFENNEVDALAYRQSPALWEFPQTESADLLRREIREDLFREFEFEMAVLELADAIQLLSRDPSKRRLINLLSAHSERIIACAAIEDFDHEGLYAEHIVQKRKREERLARKQYEK